MQPTGKDEPNFMEFYVVFTDGTELGYPWRWFTREGFRHVGVYMAFLDGILAYEHTVKGIRTYFYKGNVHDFMGGVGQIDGYTVVYLPRANIGKYKNKTGTILPTCVSLTQRITGLTSHAVTPYHYFKFLLRNGGHVVEKST